MSCRIVQDRAGDSVYGAIVEQVAALVGFSVVSSITPGPNNILLWASGATFGFRRTVPHVLGTALGIGAMALVAAVAAGAILAAVPQLATAMKVAGSIYLLWLATQIVRAGALERTDVARPFGLVSRRRSSSSTRRPGSSRWARSRRSDRLSCRQQPGASSWR